MLVKGIPLAGLARHVSGASRDHVQPHPRLPAKTELLTLNLENTGSGSEVQMSLTMLVKVRPTPIID